MEAEWEKEYIKPLKLNSEDANRSRSSDEPNKYSLHLDTNSSGSSSSSPSPEKSDIIIPAIDLFALPKEPLKLNTEDADRSRSSNELNTYSLHLDTNSSGSSSSSPSPEKSDIIIPAIDLFALPKDFNDPLCLNSPSSVASDDDLFQVIPTKVTEPQADVHCTGELEDHNQESLKDRIFSDISVVSNESDFGSLGRRSTCSISDIVLEPAGHSLSPTQSPPVQTMDRSGGSELYRIPSSVFARSHASTPFDWSVTSNDSLFSIHLGNPSFSREQDMMWGMDLNKSKELMKPPETSQFTPTPPTFVVSNDDATAEVEKVFNESQRSAFAQKHDDGRTKGQAGPNAATTINSSRRSVESETSTQSFTFPVLSGVYRSETIRVETPQKHSHPFQSLQQYVHTPSRSPSRKPSSRRCCPCCGSCCSYRFCCFSCQCRSCRWCKSCFLCRSCRSCCCCNSCCYGSCCQCYTTFSCHPWRCCKNMLFRK